MNHDGANDGANHRANDGANDGNARNGDDGDRAHVRGPSPSRSPWYRQSRQRSGVLHTDTAGGGGGGGGGGGEKEEDEDEGKEGGKEEKHGLFSLHRWRWGRGSKQAGSSPGELQRALQTSHLGAAFVSATVAVAKGGVGQREEDGQEEEEEDGQEEEEEEEEEEEGEGEDEFQDALSSLNPTLEEQLARADGADAESHSHTATSPPRQQQQRPQQQQQQLSDNELGHLSIV